MPRLIDVATARPPYEIGQDAAEAFAREQFRAMPRLDRLLPLFANTGIRTRRICRPPAWYAEDHGLDEKNELILEVKSVTTRARFEEYSKTCSFEEFEKTRALEMVARCVVETGTATLYRAIGECSTEPVLKEITDCLERGETVKLSSFGSFLVRQKGQRIGRNPKTGTEVPISPRRVMVFKPSAILKQRINANGAAGQPKASSNSTAAEPAEHKSESASGG